jgi:hypothetical protein
MIHSPPRHNSESPVRRRSLVESSFSAAHRTSCFCVDARVQNTRGIPNKGAKFSSVEDGSFVPKLPCGDIVCAARRQTVAVLTADSAVRRKFVAVHQTEQRGLAETIEGSVARATRAFGPTAQRMRRLITEGNSKTRARRCSEAGLHARDEERAVRRVFGSVAACLCAVRATVIALTPSRRAGVREVRELARHDRAVQSLVRRSKRVDLSSAARRPRPGAPRSALFKASSRG